MLYCPAGKNKILPGFFTRSGISSPQQTKVDHIILWTETNLANVFSYGEVRAPGSLVSMRFSLDAPVEGHLGQPVTALMNPDAPVHRLCSECYRTPKSMVSVQVHGGMDCYCKKTKRVNNATERLNSAFEAKSACLGSVQPIRPHRTLTNGKTNERTYSWSEESIFALPTSPKHSWNRFPGQYEAPEE